MIKELTAEKQNIYDYLDLFTMWFRDVLLFKATKEVDGLIFKDQYNYIKERAKKSSYEGIENIIDAIGKARERLHSNVNFDLVMELLFMTIRENQNGKNYRCPVSECRKDLLFQSEEFSDETGRSCNRGDSPRCGIRHSGTGS